MLLLCRELDLQGVEGWQDGGEDADGYASGLDGGVLLGEGEGGFGVLGFEDGEAYDVAFGGDGACEFVALPLDLVAEEGELRGHEGFCAFGVVPAFAFDEEAEEIGLEIAGDVAWFFCGFWHGYLFFAEDTASGLLQVRRAQYTSRGMSIAERLYLDDSSTLHFTATVNDIREYARKDGVQVWQMALDRTAFYPTAGGQPHDTGLLRARARSGAALEIAVTDVMEDEHGELWHTTLKPLLAGTEVEGVVDADRRLDHMQQHSGQHLLSAVLHDAYGATTVSFHLGEADVTIDLAVEDKEAQAALIAKLPEVEARVNALIASNLPVAVRTVSGEEAQALLAACLVRKLPPRAGAIRLVEIPGIDLNACGGTHVQSLGQIGCVLLRGTERVKKTLRLHFVCGLRAVRAARQEFSQLSEAALALSTAPAEVAEKLRRLLHENKAVAKERLHLRGRLAELHAVQLAVEERSEHGVRVVYRRFADCDAEYIKLLSDKLLAAVPRTVALFESTMEEPALVLLASNLEQPRPCSAILQQALAPWDLRGGGTASLAQARVPLQQMDVVTEDVLRQLKVLG